MKIKVIFTGGTIGSRLKNGYIGLSESPYTLIDAWLKKHGNVTFETSEPYSVLSENITSRHYIRLARCISEQLDGADAAIVTHGTDTLCYTAAFLGFVFADLKIPVILVSSGYPLDDSRANGHDNFAAAVDFARCGIGGVYAVWCADGEAKIHLGTRILPHMPYSDMLYSVGGSCFGTVRAGQFAPDPNFSYGDCETKLFFKNSVPKNLEGFGKVLTLTCRPDMRYPKLESGTAAVMLESYHSGTMCADERLAEFAAQAKGLDIPLFLSGAGGRETDYESVKQYRDMGILTLPPASPSAMYVKLSLAASYNEDLKKVMQINCGGEFV